MAGFDHLDLVTVVGQALTLDGKAARGTVTFATSTLLRDTTTGQAIFPVPLAVKLDAGGTISLPLPATNDPDITPVGWVYRVTVDIEGSSKATFDLAVPYDYSGPLNLFAAAPADDSGVVYVPQPSVESDASPLLSLIFGRRAWLLQSL